MVRTSNQVNKGDQIAMKQDRPRHLRLISGLGVKMRYELSAELRYLASPEMERKFSTIFY